MNLSSGEVLNTLRSLQDKHLVRVEENFKTQVEKFTQRLCNTPFSDYEFDEAQFAIITVLLLRGPRTPGELKANVGRLHSFTDNAEVQETLNSLINREGGPLVVQLPRVPGRRDSQYAHLLSGPVADAVQPARTMPASVPRSTDTSAEPGASAEAGASAGSDASASDLADRLSTVESEVATLRAELTALKRELGVD